MCTAAAVACRWAGIMWARTWSRPAGLSPAVLPVAGATAAADTTDVVEPEGVVSVVTTGLAMAAALQKSGSIGR